MKSAKPNYAFIDSQNLNLSIQQLGWRVDWRKFRIYLRDKYNIELAYMFIGYMPENQDDLYNVLTSAGYELIFKPTLKNKDGTIKGNVDAELVLQAMIDYDKYDKAMIITGDGDFQCLVKYLYAQDKLVGVLAPNQFRYSALLKQAAREKIYFMNQLQSKLAYYKRPMMHQPEKPQEASS